MEVHGLLIMIYKKLNKKNMKKYILLLMLAVSISIVAQVGIGTATPKIVLPYLS